MNTSKSSFRFLRAFVILVSLALVAVGFQNCSKSGANDQKLKFGNANPDTQNSGNGQPYEGKPDEGDYYRVIPGFLCDNGQAKVAGKLSISSSGLKLQSTNAKDCSVTETQVQASEVESLTYDKTNLGFGPGIYEKRLNTPDPVADASETLCRSDDGSFNILVKPAANGALNAIFSNAAGLKTNLLPVRNVAGSQMTYSAPGFNLNVQLSVSDITKGQLTGSISNGPVSCRTTVKPAAATGVDGYFVLSNSVTNANLGGRMGANAYCVSELQRQPFKGKANAIIDASHVFAFICDSAGCLNLPPNRSFSFAKAGDGAIGGRKFTSDANGSGPGSSFWWNTADTFGGNYLYWSAYSWQDTPNAWPLVPDSASSTCNNWTNSANNVVGAVGLTNAYNDARWSNGDNICSDRNHLLCVVIAPQ